MQKSSLKKLAKKIVTSLLGEGGFSIVELLVAMVILVLLVFALTPLFLGSLERIYFSGDKSEALFEGQADIEVKIVSKDSEYGVDSTEVIFTFADGNIIRVPGAVIESTVTHESAMAWLSAFIPYLPAIQLNYLFLDEGYNPYPTYDNLEVLLMGSGTNFSDDLEFKLVDVTEDDTVLKMNSVGESPPESDRLEHDYSADYGGYDQYALFNLPIGLTNAKSPYTVEIEWNLDGVDIFARKRIMVSHPLAVAVGGSELELVLVSPGVNEIWNQRNNSVDLGSMNAVIFAENRYLIINESGGVYTWHDQSEPALTHSAGASLNDIVYNEAGVLVAVGDSGTIIISTDSGSTWQAQAIPVTDTYPDLNSVHFGNEIFMAVGSSGAVYKSNDGVQWVETEKPTGVNVNLYGIAYGNEKWVAVGEESGQAVVYLLKPDRWEEVHITNGDGEIINYSSKLNDIVYNGSEFLAVGDGGLILSLPDGLNWSKKNVTESDFYTAIWDSVNEGYLISGSGGIYIHSLNSNKYLYTGLPVKGVALRGE